MEFIILGIAIFFGIIIGWHARERYAMRVVHQLLERVDEQHEADEEERTKMRLEKHGEMIYAFIVENDEFIAQGKDLHELDKAMQVRFPGRKFSVEEQNLKDIAVEYHEPV